MLLHDVITKMIEEIQNAVANWESCFEIIYNTKNIDIDNETYTVVTFTINYHPYEDERVKASYDITCRWSESGGVKFEFGEDNWSSVDQANIFAYFWFKEIYK